MTDTDRSRAENLAREFGGEALAPDALANCPAAVLINATPVGMAPHGEEMPIDPHLLARFRVIMEIVYRPLETMLLKEARARGCQVIDGLQMLIHQGAAQFEMWTGQKAPVETMARTAYAALAGEN